jgi:vancomycin resistance protein VanJ
MESRMRGALRVLAGLAWAYLAALVAFALLVVLVGERSWAGSVALYLPRLPLLLPLVALAPLAWDRARRRLVGAQAAFAMAVVLWLAGLHVSWPRGTSGAPSVRVLSYNVWYGKRDLDAIEREVLAADAGVIVLQAARPVVAERLRDRLGASWSFVVRGEFVVASRYPIVTCGPAGEGAGHLACTIDTPLGLVDLFDFHPVSPRPGLNMMFHQSKKRVLTEGPSDESMDTVASNTVSRERQATALAEAIAAAKNPVLVAGDTNLPERSSLFRAHFGGLRDGFAEAGTGFGYTFPANRWFPWMRIDRILSGPELRFTSFTVGGKDGSDHRPVWADIERP